MRIHSVRSIAFVVIVAFMAAMTAFASELKPGDQSRWSLDFRVRLEQQAAPPVEVHLQGEWSSAIVAVRRGEYDTQLQVSNIAFVGDPVKNVPASSLEDLRSRLSRPFWATYRSDGGLLAIHFFRDVSPSDCNLLQMIATELQLVRPESVRPSWTAQERDGAGEYAALYAMSGSGRIIKKKLKYMYTDGAIGPAPNALRLGIDNSAVTFALSSDGSVLAADGSSRMHLDLSLDQAQQLATVTEMHLANRRTDGAPDLIGSLERNRPDVISSAIVTHQTDPAELRAQADARLLEGHTTESLLASACAKGETDGALPDRLAALFRQRPEAAASAKALLTSKCPQRRVTNALAVAGSPAAVSALIDLARDASLSDDLRVDVLVSLLEMQQPGIEIMQLPAELVQDRSETVQSAARLISGAMARAGRVKYPEQANAIDAALIQLYRDARDPEQMIEVLRALGNSAGPSVVPVMKEASGNTRAPVRAAAARALRLAPGTEVDALLASLIANDPDPAVRFEAIFAARFRHPLPSAIADALVQAASSDSVDYVRSEAIALLRQNPNASPIIAEALAHIAETDNNPGIRRRASEALASLGAVSISKRTKVGP